MSSEEIDSTTTHNPITSGEYNPCEGGSINVLEVSQINDESATSSNRQKRKLSQSGNVDSEDDDDDDANLNEYNGADGLKKQKPNDNDSIDQNNEIASTNVGTIPTNMSNDVTGQEATGDGAGPQSAACTVKREIKEEPQDDIPSGSCEAQSTSAANVDSVVKREVKDESGAETAVKEEATSSVRDSCQYGIKCYRDEITSFPTSSKKQWTSKDIRKMLTMVEERPVIWQVDYSDRTSRPNAFLEIEKELGFPALEIKRKLHNMRCTFRNQYKSIQFHNRPVKWKYYDAMKFMYSSALTGDGADPWDDDIVTKTSDQQHQQQHKVNVPWKKRIRESKSSSVASMSSNSIPFEDDKTECNQMTRDECSVFGDYVADSLRNLPEDLKGLAKRQITHLLFDITAHTDTRHNDQHIVENPAVTMGSTTNVMYSVPDSVYGTYPQTILSETHEIQLGLHEF